MLMVRANKGGLLETSDANRLAIVVAQCFGCAF